MGSPNAMAASSGAADTGRPVAAAEGVSKSFGATRALIDVGISIGPGDAHALVGRNGAGKSTLVSMLTGLARPDTGRVLFDGEPAPPITDRAAWQRRVAGVYQKSTIIPTLSVAENLFLNRQGGGFRPIGWKQLNAQAAVLLAEYGLDVDPTAMASALPVDQRQMLEIARALSFGAKFIILDEPTAQLDGVAGAGGSGAVAFGETVAGMHKPSAGTVTVAGRAVKTGSVPSALKAGVGFLPEDRHAEGVIPLRPIAENIMLTATDRLGRHGFFTSESLRRAGSALMERLDVKAGGPDQPVAALPGGNQQTGVMGRALASEPKALGLIRPTSGVD